MNYRKSLKTLAIDLVENNISKTSFLREMDVAKEEALCLRYHVEKVQVDAQKGDAAEGSHKPEVTTSQIDYLLSSGFKPAPKGPTNWDQNEISNISLYNNSNFWPPNSPVSSQLVYADQSPSQFNPSSCTSPPTGTCSRQPLYPGPQPPCNSPFTPNDVLTKGSMQGSLKLPPLSATDSGAPAFLSSEDPSSWKSRAKDNLGASGCKVLLGGDSTGNDSLGYSSTGNNSSGNNTTGNNSNWSKKVGDCRRKVGEAESRLGDCHVLSSHGDEKALKGWNIENWQEPEEVRNCMGLDD